MNEKNPLLIRRGEAIRRLGVSREVFAKMVESGTLQVHYTHEGGRGWFFAAEIAKKIKEWGKG